MPATGERQRLNDLSGPPHSGIALIQAVYPTARDVTYYGTAFLVGQGRFATAGHMLWDTPQNALEPMVPESVTLFLGEGLYAGHPHLVFRIDPAGPAVRVHPDFMAGDGDRDLATLQVPGVPAAPLPVLGFPGDLKAGEAVTLSGYPIDYKPFGAYQGQGPLADLKAPVFTYQMDSSRGDSGAPVRVVRNDVWQAIGLHLGQAQSGGGPLKRALALTPEIVAWLHAL